MPLLAYSKGYFASLNFPKVWKIRGAKQFLWDGSVYSILKQLHLCYFSQQRPARWVLLSPFYWWKNWGSETQSIFLKAMGPVSSRAKWSWAAGTIIMCFPPITLHPQQNVCVSLEISVFPSYPFWPLQTWAVILGAPLYITLSASRKSSNWGPLFSL